MQLADLAITTGSKIVTQRYAPNAISAHIVDDLTRFPAHARCSALLERGDWCRNSANSRNARDIRSRVISACSQCFQGIDLDHIPDDLYVDWDEPPPIIEGEAR